MSKTRSIICAGTVLLLAGCMTPSDRAAKQALDDRPQLGVTFEPEWYSENDVMIKDVPGGSNAANAGLKPLDKITAVDGRAVRSMQDLREIELSETHGKVVPVIIVRDGKSLQYQVRLQ